MANNNGRKLSLGSITNKLLQLRLLSWMVILIVIALVIISLFFVTNDKGETKQKKLSLAARSISASNKEQSTLVKVSTTKYILTKKSKPMIIEIKKGVSLKIIDHSKQLKDVMIPSNDNQIQRIKIAFVHEGTYILVGKKGHVIQHINVRVTDRRTKVQEAKSSLAESSPEVNSSSLDETTVTESGVTDTTVADSVASETTVEGYYYDVNNTEESGISTTSDTTSYDIASDETPTSETSTESSQPITPVEPTTEDSSSNLDEQPNQ